MGSSFFGSDPNTADAVTKSSNYEGTPPEPTEVINPQQGAYLPVEDIAGIADNINQDAAAAAASAASAAASASAAAASASSMTASVTSASNSAAAAAASATSASASATSASGSASSASSSASSASGSASSAATSATNAGNSATAAAGSASSASTYATSAANAAAGWSGTSSTSVAIGTGSKSFTASTGKLWVVGVLLQIASASAPTNYMHGAVTAYNSGTGALTVNVLDVGGSGTLSDWNVTLAGTQGPQGPAGVVLDGDKGDITVSSTGTVFTIDPQAVTYAKIQNVSATNKLLGRATAGAGSIEEIPCTPFARTVLDDADAATARTTLGAQAALGYTPLNKAGDTLSGILSSPYGQGTYTIASSPPGAVVTYQVYGDAVSPAIMVFHRIGAFAGYFGIDTDNKWKIGGWSHGAVSYELHHEGNTPITAFAKTVLDDPSAAAVRDTIGAAPQNGGEIQATLSGGGNLRMLGPANYGAFFRNDDTALYLLLTASGDRYGGWSTLRPFTVILSNGNVAIGGSAFTAAHNGACSFGDASGTRANLGLGSAATLNVGTSANNVVQLDGSAKLPAVDGSQLTGISAGSAEPQGACYLSKSSSNLLLSRKNGRSLWINGANATIPSGGVTLAATGLSASTFYYIYAYMSGGTMTLEASTTAPTADTTYGHQIKTGDGTRSLVGAAYTDTGPAWADTNGKLWVLSYFNRLRKGSRTTFTTNRTTTSTSGTEINSEIRCNFIVWGDTPARVWQNTVALNSSGGNSVQGGNAVDSTSVYKDSCQSTVAVANGAACFAATSLVSGLTENATHYATVLGHVNAGTGTWISAQTALYVEVLG